MRHIQLAASGALGIVALIALSACAGSATTAASAGSDSRIVSTTQAHGKTLTVWVMEGDYQDKTLGAINDAFTAQTGAKVNIQIQQWDGIATKLSTALATSTPPDVIDIGNTQVPGYAANGGLLDLTPYQKDLKQGQTWLGGLEDPARVDGSLYAIPGFAGTRAVIYNKSMWAAAGVTKTPTTYAELTSDLDKVKSTHPEADFSPFYYPGAYWQSSMQFVWDAGGEIAVQKNGKWAGGFSSAKAQQGLADFKAFQNTYSTGASATLDNITPDQNRIFADGKTSAILNTGGGIGAIVKDNPAITADMLGTFPFPGKSGKAQPTMLGGSDWGIPAKSRNTNLGLQWVKIAASPNIQNKYVFGVEGWIPNSLQGIKAAQAQGLSPQQEGFFAAALNSKATPAAANWPAIEADKTINGLFTSVASGTKSPKEAAATLDAHMNTVLNGK